MRCPECGAVANRGDGKVLSAPKLALTRANPYAPTGEYLREIAPREYRTGVLMTWAGCTACEWCGSVSETLED